MPEPMLSIIEAKPIPVVVERLTEALNLAKSGEITGIAFVTINKGGEIGECYCGSVCREVYRTIGALEALKVRVIHQNVEGV